MRQESRLGVFSGKSISISSSWFLSFEGIKKSRSSRTMMVWSCSSSGASSDLSCTNYNFVQKCQNPNSWTYIQIQEYSWKYYFICKEYEFFFSFLVIFKINIFIEPEVYWFLTSFILRSMRGCQGGFLNTILVQLLFYFYVQHWWWVSFFFSFLNSRMFLSFKSRCFGFIKFLLSFQFFFWLSPFHTTWQTFYDIGKRERDSRVYQRSLEHKTLFSPWMCFQECFILACYFISFFYPFSCVRTVRNPFFIFSSYEIHIPNSRFLSCMVRVFFLDKSYSIIYLGGLWRCCVVDDMVE